MVEDKEPLEARTKSASVEAVIRGILQQADAKGHASDVAKHLVAAHIALRLNREARATRVKEPSRKCRSAQRTETGSFEVEEAIFEVAVGLPDRTCLGQIVGALRRKTREVWVLTKQDRVATWTNELAKCEGIDMRRIVVMSVEAFVGQSITQLGGFSSQGKITHLQELFSLYNFRRGNQPSIPRIRIIST